MKEVFFVVFKVVPAAASFSFFENIFIPGVTFIWKMEGRIHSHLWLSRLSLKSPKGYKKSPKGYKKSSNGYKKSPKHCQDSFH